MQGTTEQTSKEFLAHYNSKKSIALQSKLLNLSEQENNELLKLIEELFTGYPIQEITKEFEVILDNGTKFELLPDLNNPNERTEDYVLNNPSIIEQLLTIYVPGSNWKFDPKHDGHAGRIRHSDFFKAIYGETEKVVESRLVGVKWLEKTFKDPGKIIKVTGVMDLDKKFHELSRELDGLIERLEDTNKDKENYLKFLREISGTFCWRVIANTNRISAHSFGMTLDLNATYCEYWLWDYKSLNKLPVDYNLQESNIDIKDIPIFHNSVPWEIIEIFEKHGFIWGGKWNKYDTMHFEYRPEAYANNHTKDRIRELLEKAGYKLLEPQNIHIMRQHDYKDSNPCLLVA